MNWNKLSLSALASGGPSKIGEEEDKLFCKPQQVWQFSYLGSSFFPTADCIFANRCHCLRLLPQPLWKGEVGQAAARPTFCEHHMPHLQHYIWKSITIPVALLQAATGQMTSAKNWTSPKA